MPTVQTMFVSGAWHRAGYQFILCGLLHGMGLVNQAGRLWRPTFRPRTDDYWMACLPSDLRALEAIKRLTINIGWRPRARITNRTRSGIPRVPPESTCPVWSSVPVTSIPQGFHFYAPSPKPRMSRGPTKFVTDSGRRFHASTNR